MRNKLRPQPRLQSTIRLQRIVAASIAFLLIAIGAIVWFQMGNEQDAKATNLQGYDYKKIITIDHNEVAGSSALVDFPVLLRHTDPDLKHESEGGYVENVNGYDIRPALADGTTLEYDLEYYDDETGEIVMWVRVPSLSATTDTEIHLYFGNDNVNSQQGTYQQTWNNDYKAVYHFAGDANNNANGSSFNATRNNTSTTSNGFIGEGEEFDGNNDYLTINQSVIPNTGAFTISMWVKQDNNNKHQLLDMDGSGGGKIELKMDDKDDNEKVKVEFKVKGTEEEAKVDEEYNYSSNSWKYITLVSEWSGNNNSDTRLYIDGRQEDTDNDKTGNMFNNSTDLFVGAKIDGNSVKEEFNGTIDELRISKVQLSSDWIETEYNNQSDPENFYSMACLIDLNAVGAQPTTLAGYTQRIELTVNSNYVVGETHSNFPVRVVLSDNTLRHTSQGGNMESSDGYDAYFAANDGTTALNFEIESYDDATGELIAWVEMPSIQPCSDTKFYLYYGKPGQSVDPSSALVWSNSGFEVVSHFDSNVQDQSGNGNHGSNSGSSSASGNMGNARKFNGNSDRVSYNSNISLSQGTISFWYKPNSNKNSNLQNSESLISKYVDWDDHFSIVLAGDEDDFASDGEIYFKIEDGPHYVVRSEGNSWNSNNWYHITGIWDGDMMALYIDGTLQGTEQSESFNFELNNSADLNIGFGEIEIDGGDTRSRSLDASIDEFRLSPTVRSSNWIATEYNAIMEGGFITYSAPTPLNPNGWLLPIELSYFTATPTKDGEVELAWETLVEINNDFFTIERSADGKTFEPIMKVSGMINSSSPTRYVEYDTEPLSGFSFYRLKQTDLDGQSETFPIQQVYIAPADVALQIVQAYPNPTTGPVTVVVQSDEAQTVTAQLIDASGRLRWSDNWSLWSQQERFNIDLSDYAAGYYILQVTTESGQQETIKLLRAR